MTVLGVGVDVADAARFTHLAGSAAFVGRWFTPEEAHRCLRRPDPGLALAACWAVKEAVWKAIGPAAWDGPLPWAGIAVSEGRPGAYRVELSGRAAALASGVPAVSVGVLAERRIAVATCVLYAP